jgi:hypothetical protein
MATEQLQKTMHELKTPQTHSSLRRHEHSSGLKVGHQTDPRCMMKYRRDESKKETKAPSGLWRGESGGAKVCGIAGGFIGICAGSVGGYFLSRMVSGTSFGSIIIPMFAAIGTALGFSIGYLIGSGRKTD